MSISVCILYSVFCILYSVFCILYSYKVQSKFLTNNLFLISFNPHQSSPARGRVNRCSHPLWLCTPTHKPSNVLTAWFAVLCSRVTHFYRYQCDLHAKATSIGIVDTFLPHHCLPPPLPPLPPTASLPATCRQLPCQLPIQLTTASF